MIHQLPQTEIERLVNSLQSELSTPQSSEAIMELPAENTELLEFASLRQQRTGIRHEYESPKLFLWHKE